MITPRAVDQLNRPYDYDPVQKKCTIRGATELPQELFEIADEIEVLDASFGQLSSLPNNLGDLRNLRVAFFSNNEFTTIPNVLSSCRNLEMVGFKSCKIEVIDPTALPTSLRGLILTDNRIAEIPDSIDQLTALEKLMLTGNRISRLPDALLTLESLQLLRISLNQLKKSPDHIFQLPKLAWYSDSGNDFNRQVVRDELTPSFSWNNIEIENILGQSSKNIVYGGTLEGNHIAVKIFGSGVTTDGDPTNDMNVSLAAGEHPHIIGGIGRVRNCPDGKTGFLMPKIPVDYKPLGMPPNFETLTRDVFSSDLQISEAYALKVATTVASAMTHLTGKAIMHGDIYAHNILTRSDGSSIIGDFGAASQYIPGSVSGTLREKIDVRGFGYLIDDLLLNGSHANSRLVDLREACLADNPSQRPTFRDMYASLS